MWEQYLDLVVVSLTFLLTIFHSQSNESLKLLRKVQTSVSWSLTKDWLHVEGVFAVFLAPALRHCLEWLHLFPVFRCHSISYLGCRI